MMMKRWFRVELPLKQFFVMMMTGCTTVRVLEHCFRLESIAFDLEGIVKITCV